MARGDERPRIELEWDLGHGAALQRHPLARMAWRRNHGATHASLFCSGRTLHLPLDDARRLADAPSLDGAGWQALSPAGRDAVHALLPGRLLRPAERRS